MQLYLNVGGWKVAELYSNDPVNLTYRFSDVSELNKAASTYSQTFRLPLTTQNAAIFGEVTLGQVPDFRYKAKIPARIVRSGFTLVEGYAQVKGFFQQKGKYTDVELTFFGEGADLSRAVGDGLLTDLDLSAYDTALTQGNIEDGCSNTGLFSGVLRFGLVDRGYNWSEDNNPLRNDTPITLDRLTPYVRVRTILDAIFTAAGCTYESTWLNGQQGLYLMALAGRELYTTAIYQRNALYVGLQANSGVSAATWTNLVLSETTPFYDDVSAWSGDTFTPPVTGYYTFEFYYRFSIAQTYQFRTVGTVTGTSTAIAGNAIPPNNVVQYRQTILLVGGESVNFQVYGASAFSLVYSSNERQNTRIRLVEYWQSEGATLNLSRNLPKLKQIEFLSGLQKAFNLVFIPDRNRPKHYYVEPLPDYLTAGAVKDWTGKLDLNKDVRVTPTTDLQKRKYVWSLGDSEDLINAAVKQDEGETYGTFTIEDTGNDFAQGEQKITVPFAPYVTEEINGHPVLKLLKAATTSNTAIDEPKPFLCYYNGFEAGNIYFKSVAYGNFDVSAPLFSAYSQYRGLIKGFSLFFGYPAPFHDMDALPLRSLYYWYYAAWFNGLYSEDARILTAHFQLTAEDVAAFEFADKVYLFNAYWRVLEVTNYDATQDGTTQVKLLKVLGTVNDCEDVPDTAVHGIISGVVSSLSKKCCERYGYTFDPNTLRCLLPPQNVL